MPSLIRLSFLFFLCMCLPAIGQSDTATLVWRVGLFGSYDLNRHNADFRGLPGVPSCCPQYSTGDGNGQLLGALVEVVPDSAWALSLRAGYSVVNAVLTSKEPVVLTGIVDGVIEHRIDARFSLMGIEPAFIWKPVGGLNVQVGVLAGLLIRGRFDQREELVSPQEGTFENGERIRFSYSDQDIPQSSALEVSLIGRIGYELPLNRTGTLAVVPEISYSYGLTPLVSGLEWTANIARFGLALKYTLNPPPSAF